MRRLFYCTRNIAGLILVISPLVGFLYIDYNFTLSMVFMCALALGVFLGSACYELLNFRLWTSLASIASCIGALLLHSDSGNTPASAAGMCFIGLYAGGLAAIVPANLLTGWFRASKTLLAGAVYGISVIAGLCIGFFMERYTYAVVCLCLVMMLTGTIIFLQRPPLFLNSPVQCKDRRFVCGKRAVTIKLFFFVLAAGFAAGLTLFRPENDAARNLTISSDIILALGLISGPFAAGLISEYKSAYGGCILIIFLAEISVFNFDGIQAGPALYISSLACGMCFSAMVVTIPIAVFYTYGPQGYNSCLPKVWSALPAGLAAACAVRRLSADVPAGSSYATISPQTASVFLMIMLTACFFTIFSAWRHRFILLKPTRR